MKQIIIEGEGLAALYDVVNTANYNSNAEARKYYVCGCCLEKEHKAYNQTLKDLDERFLKEMVIDGRKLKRVPEADIPTFQEEFKKLREVKYTITLDPESFAVAKSAVMKYFDRKDIKESGGINNLERARLIHQMCVALEQATELA